MPSALPILLVLVTITSAPYAVQSFYWQSGAMGYAVGLALLTGLLYVVLRDRRLLALLLAFVTAGTTDTMAVVLPVVLIFTYLLCRRRAAFSALVGAILGLLVMVSAPGNAIRQSYFPGSTLPLAIIYSIRAAGVPFANALRASPIAVVGLIVLPALLGERRVEREQIKLAALILLVGMLAVNVAAEFASYYPTGVPLTGRAEPIPVYLTLAGGMMLSGLVGQCWSLHRPRLARAVTVLVALTCTVQAGSLAIGLYRSGLGLSDSGAERCIEALHE